MFSHVLGRVGEVLHAQDSDRQIVCPCATWVRTRSKHAYIPMQAGMSISAVQAVSLGGFRRDRFASRAGFFTC